MLNPFTIRRALRDHSLTFALVLALAVAGVSTWGSLYSGLRRVHVPWPVALVLPFLLVAWVSRREDRIVRDPVLRRRIAVGLVVAALLVWLLA
jgi:hypothetical protein